MANITNNITDNIKGFPYVSGFIELFIATSIYTTSPNFGSFDAICVSGMNLTNIIRKANINSGFGYIISDEKALEKDYNDCSDKLSF